MIKSLYKENRHCLLCNKQFVAYKHGKEKFCSLMCAYSYRSRFDYLKTKKIINQLNESFLIWFTGFWEGEGSINILRKQKNFHLSICQKEKRIMFTIKKTFKFGWIYHHSQSFGCWEWHVSRLGQILALIEAMKSHIKLLHREQQINTFLNCKRIIHLKKYV